MTCLSSPSAWAATADTPSGGFRATLLTGVGGARGPFAWRLRLGPCPVLPRQRPRFGGSALTTQSPPKGLLSKYRHTGGRGLHVAAGATDHLSEAVTCQDAIGLPANESGTPTPLQAPRPAPRDPDSATGAMSGSLRPLTLRIREVGGSDVAQTDPKFTPTTDAQGTVPSGKHPALAKSPPKARNRAWRQRHGVPKPAPRATT